MRCSLYSRDSNCRKSADNGIDGNSGPRFKSFGFQSLRRVGTAVSSEAKNMYSILLDKIAEISPVLGTAFEPRQYLNSRWYFEFARKRRRSLDARERLDRQPTIRRVLRGAERSSLVEGPTAGRSWNGSSLYDAPRFRREYC